MKRLCRAAMALALAATLWTACSQSSRRQAKYEQMIDSIRRAEVARTLLKADGVGDPVATFFDTLALKPLPMQYSKGFVDYLPQMKQVPADFNARFDYASDAVLYAMRLPSAGDHRLAVVAERLDSATTLLYLCTLNSDYVLEDRLLMYEEKREERKGEKGTVRQEYYITSDHEITLLRHFRPDAPAAAATEESARRYIVNNEGLFEEIIIEL